MTTYTRTIQLDKAIGPGDELDIIIKGPAVVVPPTPTLPTQVASGPLTFTTDGQVIENKIIDIAPGRAVTLADQVNATPTASIYGKGRKGCVLRNVTLRGRQWGALLIDMVDFVAEDVTVLDVNYCAFGIFGGSNGRLTRPSGKRIAMLRTNGLPSIGDAGNSYAVKFETASQAGGTSGVPVGWLIDQGLFEDIPLWQAVNAHGGHNIVVQDTIVRRAARAYFFAGSDILNLSLLRNQALECSPAGAFPSGDKQGIELSGVQGATVTGNAVSKTFNPPVGVINASGVTGLASSGNTVVA